MIPARLGELCTLNYGKALRGYKKEHQETLPVEVFGTNGPIGWATTPLYEKPTIIIGRKGAYRGVHYASGPSWTIDTAYYLTLRSGGVDLKWLYYRLLLVDINRMDTGAAIPSTKREDFYSVGIGVPPFHEQKYIASILSTYDDLIENNRRRIQLLEQAARLLYKEWFVHLRFPGHEHAEVTGGIPFGWTRPILGEVINLKRGYDLPASKRKPGTVPVVSSSGITGFHDAAKAIAPGVVTGRYGTLGAVYLVQDDFWPLNTALYVQDFRDNNRHFAFHLLGDVLRGLSSSKAAVPGVNRNDLHRIHILRPPGQLQKLFADTVFPIHKQVTTLEQQVSKLSNARDLILPRLMSGKIAA